jgi:hypothetical protein
VGEMSTRSWTVHLRPVRLSFVVEEVSVRTVVGAARLARGVWGGVYFPLFNAGDPDRLMRAQALGIDVLHSLAAPCRGQRVRAPSFDSLIAGVRVHAI